MSRLKFTAGCLMLIILFICPSNLLMGQKKDVTILFVGNSLTYSNDLPALVSQLARKKNIKIKSELLAFPNYALEDHWNDGKLQQMIVTHHYDYVIVQQGPSSQSDGRQMLLEYGDRIQELCRQNRTTLAFFMVWPSRENYRMFDGVIKNYSDAALQSGALLCPVGKRWKAYMDSMNDYSYYSEDNFHPSMKGSKAAATVIVESLFGK